MKHTVKQEKGNYGHTGVSYTVREPETRFGKEAQQVLEQVVWFEKLVKTRRSLSQLTDCVSRQQLLNDIDDMLGTIDPDRVKSQAIMEQKEGALQQAQQMINLLLDEKASLEDSLALYKKLVADLERRIESDALVYGFWENPWWVAFRRFFSGR